MSPCKNKITGIAWLAIALLASLMLVACGGGGDSGGQSSAPIQTGVDEIAPGGNNVSPDSNLVIATFSDVATAQTSVAATQAGLAALPSPNLQAGLISGTASYLSGPVTWLSQYSTSASCKTTGNGYCGQASILMGATYLKAKNLEAPTHYGYGTENDNVVGNWIEKKINDAFPGNAYYLNSCGGSEGIYFNDIKILASNLGIYAVEFVEPTSQAEQWIKYALANNHPVVARVHYQGRNCSGQSWTETTEAFYNNGNRTQDMTTCYAVYKNHKQVGPGSASRASLTSLGEPTELGHFVMITNIDQNTVTVYDPDPYAKNDQAGIRRYSKNSFFSVLKTRYPSTNFKPTLYELCSGADCPPEPNAFSTTAAAIELSTNQNYSAGNTQPIVNALASDSVFSATGLPDGLYMDTEGRIVGNTAIAGTYSVTVTMKSRANSILRYAYSLMTVVTKANASIIEAMQFVTPSILRATVGNTYYQALAITGTAETVTLNKISGNLPPGLVLQNGQIVGTPTQYGEYSVDIQASTPTSNVTKTFTLVVDPAPASAVPAPQSVLSGINPSSVTGMEGQQTVVFMGSGFADGARVELTDTTNGGTYSKTPVSINSAGTEITIRANFTTSPATWSARIIPLTGNSSATITFNVVAPVSAGPVISSVSPSVLTASSSTQTITVTGTNYRTGAVVEITNLAAGIRTSVQPVASTSVQLAVSYPFATASMWGVRVINSDGTSSASTDILVNAPTSTVAPAMPSLVSPGTAVGPGTVLSNTTTSLSWSGNASASYYVVAVRDLSSGVLVVDATTVTPSYALTLLEGKQYRWNAAACNAAGCSSYAAPLYFQSPQPTVAVPIPAISSLSITSVPADSTVRPLVIYGSSFAAGNVVKYRWLNPAGSSTTSATVNSASQISTTFNPGNVADTIYVKVCQSASSSACSSELPIFVTVATVSCTAPQVLQNGVCVSPTPTCTLPQVLTNGVCVTPSATAPDLLVLSGVVSPSSVSAGGTVSASWSISNQGTGTANASTTVVRINQSTTSAAGTNLTSISTNSLASGGSQSQSANLTAPTTAGTYYVWVIADNSSTAGQSTSATANDLVRIGSFTVAAVATAPDLQVLSGTVSPSSVSAGGTVSASWSISNQGTGTANASTTVVRINQSTTSAAGTNLTSISTNSLASGGSQSQSASLTAPTTAGTYYVWVIADNSSTAGQSTSAAANDLVRIGSFTVATATVTPAISSLSSYSFNGACSAQPLTIYGSNFVSGATVNLYDQTHGVSYPNRATTFNSSGQLTLSATYGGSAANWSLTVVNPSGSSSSSANFSVIGPSITGVSPNPVPRLNGAQTITFYGSGFLSGAAVQIDDGTGPYAKTPIVLSSGQMTISANLTSAPAIWKASIRNCPGLVDTWSPWFNF